MNPCVLWIDEICFVDLPSPGVRADILRIHLKMRDLDVKSFDLAEMTQASDGFSGAEIEQAIISALYTASALEEPLATAHVLAECRRTRLLSVVMREKIQGLRALGRGADRAGGLNVRIPSFSLGDAVDQQGAEQ